MKYIALIAAVLMMAVLSRIGKVRSGAYWWDIELSKGGLTNRLAFLDWLINELEKSQENK